MAKTYSWIHVNDKLPEASIYETGVCVWASTGLDRFIAWFTHTLHYENYRWEDDTGTVRDDIQYWMPLPEPPEKAEA